ncbi:MAG: hypothetical protein RLZZ234_741, partial [Candidatus Parcubacteria bacterium]
TSPDGITWTSRTSAADNTWRSVTYGNGLFVAVAQTGTGNRVMTSTDGITWTSRTSAADNSWYSVTYGNGLFVAVAFSGTGNRVMTSPDGITWTSRTSAADHVWDSVTYANGLFVAVACGVTGISCNATAGNRVMTSSSTALSTTIATFGANASTSAFSIGASTTVYAPSRLTITGNYTNASGTFMAGTGTTTFAGTSSQVATGTLSGASAFYNLEVVNTGGTTTLATTTTVTNVFTAVASTTVAFPAGATTTIATLNLRGAAANKMFIRSTQNGVAAKLNVTASLDNNYLDVQDSDVTPGIDLTAYRSTNSGNTTAWTFAAAPTMSSASNQEFFIGQATTSIAVITVADALLPSITSTNDIRLIIATSTHNMRWNTYDTSAVFGGTASGKVSGTVSYEGGGSVLVIDVTSNFSASDTLTIGGLSFSQFTVVAGPVPALGLSYDGDQTVDSVDTATLAIGGSLAVGEHDLGQAESAFTSHNQTGATLYRFKMTPFGETINIGTLTFALTGVRRIDSENLTNIWLYRDYNANGMVDGADATTSSAGVLLVNGQSGSITFTTTFEATTTQNYLVASDITGVKPNEYMTMSLAVSGTVTGAMSLATISPTGSVSSVQHIRGGDAGGGGGGNGASGAIGGDAPAGQATTTGGGQGGGEEIGETPGFQAPTAQGTPHNEWATGANGLLSDGSYATAASANLRQSYSVFGFNVPGANTVTGVEVKLEASGSTAAGTIEVALSWDGGTSVTATKATTILTGSDVVYTLGGEGDTWGRTWAPAELGNANFFVRVIAQPNSNTVRVDAVQVKPYHAATGGGGGGGGGEI